jgi:glycosyltransferase involved in cell wall biosynthesis
MNVLTIPVPRKGLERRIATWLLASQIKPAIKAAGLVKPLLWTSLPTAVDACGRLDETGLVYYCGDDFSSLEGVDHKVVADRERELLARADLVVAASEKLAISLPSRDTRLLPHGVDYKLFTTPMQRAADFPETGHPVAGFYGSISTWLDLDLIEAVVSRLPDWHFLFIGKPAVDTGRLSCYANVTFLGERPHSQLPSYSQHWTVSLLPFVDNPQIRACNPLKLREYLAAGKPVVSTRFPAAEQYADVINIVDNADAMIRALQLSAMATPNPSQRDIVADHTWTARASELSGWLEAL